MLRLITDFDGPIMDVSERYYRVYQYCLQQTKNLEQKVEELSKEEFWRLKRAQVPERQIGIISGLNQEQAKEFASLRRRTVHSEPYLKYDQILPGVRETLEKIKTLEFHLVVMTLRRVKELEEPLNRFNLKQFFPPENRYCLPDDYVKTTDVQDKPLLMDKALGELPPPADVWMVGDTEADIVSAKTHKVKVIGLLSGIRDRTQLESYEPDFIVNNFAEAVDLIAAAVPALSCN